MADRSDRGQRAVRPLTRAGKRSANSAGRADKASGNHGKDAIDTANPVEACFPEQRNPSWIAARVDHSQPMPNRRPEQLRRPSPCDAATDITRQLSQRGLVRREQTALDDTSLTCRVSV